MAHRAMYVLQYGFIPYEYVIDHLCRNRSCVNPLRMETVERAENTRRGISPSVLASRRGTCSLGHPFIRLRNGRQRCAECYAKMINAYHRDWRAANLSRSKAYHSAYSKEWRRRRRAARTEAAR